MCPVTPRFSPQANTAETRESRRLPRTPSAMHSRVAFDSFIVGSQSCIAPGNSREPPAATFFGSRADTNTRGRRTHSKAAPLQAVGNGTSPERASSLEDEDDYDMSVLGTDMFSDANVPP